MLLMGTFYIGLGCNTGSNETAEETSQFEVASPEPIEDGEEPISSLAELAAFLPRQGRPVTWMGRGANRGPSVTRGDRFERGPVGFARWRRESDSGISSTDLSTTRISQYRRRGDRVASQLQRQAAEAAHGCRC